MDEPNAPRPADAPGATEPPASPPPAAPPPEAAAPVPVVPPPASAAPAYWQSDPTGPTGPAPGVEFAGYGARIIAYIIDTIIISIGVGILVFIAILLGGGDTSGPVAITLIGFSILLSLLYFPFFWQRDGQTPGMSIFDIRVVRDQDGGKVDWLHAILRFIGYGINSIIFGLPIGWLWVFVDKRRRGWMDLIGSTVVVKS
jgi:uncharacterized RDD family membrane protein YckC